MRDPAVVWVIGAIGIGAGPETTGWIFREGVTLTIETTVLAHIDGRTVGRIDAVSIADTTRIKRLRLNAWR